MKIRRFTRDEIIEVVSAVVLSASGLLTTWSGYQSALWDGDQAAQYAQAGVIRTTAAREAMEADMRQAVTVQMFTSWLDAKAAEEQQLADFYRARMPVEFQPTFEKWLSLEPLKTPKAPPTPFAMAGYEPQGRAKQRQLEQAADAAFAQGQKANDISDAYVRATVTLGTAMFFAGIAQVFRLPQARMVLLAVSLLACVWGTAKALSLPVAQIGG